MNLDVSTRLGYDIACALRGPDSNSPLCFNLKELVTKRIRWAVGAGSFVRDRAFPREAEENLVELIQAVTVEPQENLVNVIESMGVTPRTGLLHFVGHLEVGLLALQQVESKISTEELILLYAFIGYLKLLLELGSALLKVNCINSLRKYQDHCYEQL